MRTREDEALANRLRPAIAEMKAILLRIERLVPEPPEEDSIDQLGIAIRAYNCLSFQGIRSITQLRAMSNSDLLSIPNLGIGTLTMIKMALEEYDKERASP